MIYNILEVAFEFNDCSNWSNWERMFFLLCLLIALMLELIFLHSSRSTGLLLSVW